MAVRAIIAGAFLAAALLAQEIPVREIDAFQRTRREAAGGARLAATEALARHPHPRNLPLFLPALERNGRDVAELLDTIEQLGRRAETLARELAGLGDRAAPAKKERLEKDLLAAKGDADYREAQVAEIGRECEVLRRGILDAWQRLEGEDRETRLGELRSLMRNARAWPLRRELILLLSGFHVPATAEALGELVRDDKDPGVRAAAAAALGQKEMPGAEELVLPALADGHALVRAAALRALRVVGGARAVEVLIERLPEEKGRLLEDVIVVLRHLAGVNYFDNVVLWREWWAKEKPRYQPPDARRGAPGEESAGDPAAPGAGFYGIRTRSEAVVFVIDTSGSMAEPAISEGTTGSGPVRETKLDRAKRELIRTINGLPVGVSLNVVAYGEELELYAKTMVRLKDDTRRSLVAWVKSLEAKGRTNLYGALEWVMATARGGTRALPKEMIIDTVYLLSDGRPTAGRITDSRMLAAAIARMNELTGVVIHCVGVGADHDAWLLKELSERSRGVYIRSR